MSNPQASSVPGGAIVRRPPSPNQAPALAPGAAPSQPLAVQLSGGDNAESSESNLLNYWQILIKRKWVVISVLATVLMIVLVATMLTPSIYRSTVTLQIDLETIKVVQTEGVTPTEGIGNRDYYQTQNELLKTRALAERVAAKLPEDLSAVRESRAPSAFSRLIGALRGRPAADPAA